MLYWIPEVGEFDIRSHGKTYREDDVDVKNWYMKPQIPVLDMDIPGKVYQLPHYWSMDSVLASLLEEVQSYVRSETGGQIPPVLRVIDKIIDQELDPGNDTHNKYRVSDRWFLEPPTLHTVQDKYNNLTLAKMAIEAKHRDNPAHGPWYLYRWGHHGPQREVSFSPTGRAQVRPFDADGL